MSYGALAAGRRRLITSEPEQRGSVWSDSNGSEAEVTTSWCVFVSDLMLRHVCRSTTSSRLLKSLFPEWRWEMCWAETCFQDLPASLTSLHSSSLSCLSSADVSSFSSVSLQTFMITDHYPPLLLMNVVTTVWTLTLTPSDAASPGNQPEFKMFNSCERREFRVFDFVCNLDTWWMSHVSCCLILSH